MAIDFSTLLTRLGKGFYFQEVVATAASSTFPPELKDFLDQFNDTSLDLKRAISPAGDADQSLKSAVSGALSSVSQALTNVIIETVAADAPQPERTIDSALAELVRQMANESESVDASTVAATITADAGNNGDGVLVVSVRRPDGLVQENSLAEDLAVTVTTDTTPATAGLTVRGQEAEQNRLSPDWPGGSGITRSLTAVDAASSLLDNGSFDTETLVDNVPDGWIVSIGTIGTTIKMTDYEVQRITATGPPSAGTYRISWTNQDGDTQTTAPLAYDASGSAVQSALRALTGLGSVTVSTSGTTPLFTHDITFVGVAGNLSQVTITNNTTGGTYTPSTVSGGSPNAYVGKALEFDSNGAQLTAINRQVSLTRLAQYAFNIYLLADVVPEAGELTIELVDGIGGSVINDEQGTANSLTVDCTELTTSFVAHSTVFRTPRDLPDVVYLRIRISTVVSSGTSIFLDHAALTSMTELYPGGPYVAAFSGALPFRAGAGQVLPDSWTIEATNDRAGKFQEWFQRNFDMASKGLLLPSDSSASETIADSLIG